ncbi:MAG TPA: hypothetical protein VFI68_00160 [Anaerolineales bacterium]|nr:hypothetical protein [Anaerolineales bacterium]
MSKIWKYIFLAFFLTSFVLAAWDEKLSCSIQAVAGGSQYCQEEGGK